MDPMGYAASYCQLPTCKWDHASTWDAHLLATIVNPDLHVPEKNVNEADPRWKRDRVGNVASWLVAGFAIVARHLQIIQHPCLVVFFLGIVADFFADHGCFLKNA